MKKQAEISGTPQKPRVFDSIGQAAGATGHSVPLLRAAKSAGCEAFKPGGRIHEPELLEWLRTHPKIKKDSPAIARARLRILRLQGDRLQRENDEARGRLIDVGQVESDARDEALKLRGILERFLLNEAPGLLEGMSAVQIHIECKKFFLRIVDAIHAEAPQPDPPPDPPVPAPVATETAVPIP